MVLRILLAAILVLCAAASQAFEEDFYMRVSWVKTLKGFLAELEKKDADHRQLTVEERRFLRDFSLFESAWADARFDCFYGGWPSTLVSVGERRLCQSPKNLRSFTNSPCAENQLRCQPLLFGAGHCAPFGSSEERRSAYASCEKSFQKSGASYDFLRALGQRELEDLRELSKLAGEICRSGRKGTQKNTGMCRELLMKFDHGLLSIDRGWRESFPETPPAPRRASVPVAPVASAPLPPEDCPEETPAPQIKELKAIGALSLDQMYDTLREKFLRSPFCDPMLVVSDPAERPNPFLLRELSRDLGFLDVFNFSHPMSEDPRLTQVLEKYHLSPATQTEIPGLLQRITSEALGSEPRKRAILELRVTLLKDFAQDTAAQTQLRGTVKSALADNHIFQRDGAGNISCPFVSKDAFKKAMEGRSRMLQSTGSSLSKKDQLTVVDYSRPSNERRLFVIDLNSLDVVHNTWVAQGGGNGNGKGQDGFGSSPEMSNRPGSNLSSDGFVIATQAASGARFGPNVLLRGIDQNNTNMAARSVILHGWTSPMDDYSNGVSRYDFSTGTYGPTQDPVRTLLTVNPASASAAELENAVQNIRSSTWVSEYLMPTEGCLGVPKVRLGHLDRRGRNKTQLELLREDLPGSLLFNYSGPQMTSRYFQ